AYTIREAPCDVTVVKTNLKNQKLDIKETTYPEM
ncbi:universal stress protein, partial [Limosilactobacillus reuteri]